MEINFLIDSGYLENVELSGFQDYSNILDKLKVTRTGERYVEFRENIEATMNEANKKKLA